MSSPVLVERYLEVAKAEELAMELLKKGYKVSKNYKIDSISYDLLAEKDSEQIFIEIKSGKSLSDQNQLVRQKAAFVGRLKNAKFRLVVVNPPRPKLIKIENLEEELFGCFVENLPKELLELPNSIVAEVSDVEITNANINSEGILVSGDGLVEVILQGVGSDLEEGKISEYESFPFEFEVLMSHELYILECRRFFVDTASFQY